ncbi:MAG: amino acid ABC transporter permease [Desulfotalea sp.]
MRRYSGLDSPKSKAYFTFWRSAIVFVLLAISGFVYTASSYVEYNWNWDRVPQYFWFDKEVEIRVDVAGDISEITESPEGYTIVVSDGAYSETIESPKATNFLLSEGDYAYEGDIIGTYQLSQPGILLVSLWVTLKVSAFAIIIGILLGVFTGLSRISENPLLKWMAIVYIEIIRGTPLMVQIFLWYFVVGNLINALLSQTGIPSVPPLWYGVIALATFTGAYTAEIVRAGIQSVHRGQMEAARSLGLCYSQAMAKIILPQALRRIMPPLAGQFISLIKDSSLLGVIAIREVTKATREIVSTSLMPYELWITCAILYFLLTFALSLFVQYLERKSLR